MFIRVKNRDDRDRVINTQQIIAIVFDCPESNKARIEMTNDEGYYLKGYPVLVDYLREINKGVGED